MMTDEEIVTRFWKRDPSAITLTDRQYGSRCRALSRRILRNAEDADECVNESYYRLWEQIPPERPQSLGGYLSRIVRNLSLDRLREISSEKRGGKAVTVALEELGQLAGRNCPEDAVAAKELGKAIDRFLRTQTPLAAGVFLRRYFYFESREEIADRFGIRPAQVSVHLSRTRKRLAQFLTKEGYL